MCFLRVRVPCVCAPSVCAREQDAQHACACAYACLQPHQHTANHPSPRTPSSTHQHNRPPPPLGPYSSSRFPRHQRPVRGNPVPPTPSGTSSENSQDNQNNPPLAPRPLFTLIKASATVPNKPLPPRAPAQLTAPCQHNRPHSPPPLFALFKASMTRTRNRRPPRLPWRPWTRRGARDHPRIWRRSCCWC